MDLPSHNNLTKQDSQKLVYIPAFFFDSKVLYPCQTSKQMLLFFKFKMAVIFMYFST